MIHDVATRLGEVLSTPPAPLLPSGSIASRRPGAAGELPLIAISVDVEHADELGFGRLVRGSEILPPGDQVRNDLVGERISGTVAFEIWAGDPTRAGQLSRDLDMKLRSRRGGLRERGFAAVRPAALEPLEGVRHQGSTGAPFGAWRQRLAYRFVFESIEGGELSGGGLIRRVDVDVPEPTDEQFSVPPTVS